jgi:two-component system sensor histidine kinase/response regulator
MRLRKASSWVFSASLLVLAANAILLVLISRAYDDVVAVQDHRRATTLSAEQFRRETEHLTQFVRSYTATGDDRYLLYYYDILAVREGKKPAPQNFKSGSYWDDVVARRIVHTTPELGARQSFTDTMKALGFSTNEGQAFSKVVEATEAMKEDEQKAFAATQGLYDPDKQEFVADGPVRLDFAIQLVHSDSYNRLKANLSTAVENFVELVDKRTSDQVLAASQALNRWILLSLVCMSITIAAAAITLRVLRQRVLLPIHRLGKNAEKLAAGNYEARTGVLQSFDEFVALSTAVDGMAAAMQTDIERRHVTQLELERAKQVAEAATYAKSMFLANMSHEIRTPMNAILGMAYLTLRSKLEPRQHDYVSKIYDASTSLLAIINDILDFSKIEAGKINLEVGRFRLEDVAGRSLSLLRQRANEKDIELLLDVSDALLLGESGAVMGDGLRLGQVLTNLLSNAVKFTHRGFVKLKISIEENLPDSIVLRFSIQDTGIGLSQGQIENLFREFTQADGSTTRKYGGTGLGLTISKKLIDLMGGRIWIESVLGSGSSFCFTARVQKTVPTPPSAVLTPQAEALRVLIVDDQPDARAALRDLIEALGIGKSSAGTVDMAADGRLALKMIESNRDRGEPYDLLLLDWIMPGFDGSDVLKILKGKAVDSRPLVVVVSAYDSDILQDAAEALGAARFLPKPVLPESLRDIIRSIASEGSLAAADTAPESLEVSLVGMRFLLAEDNPINQQLAFELLDSRGAEIDVVENGKEAIEKLDARPSGYYDAVLMDLQMPVMDGYEATRLLRLNSKSIDLPIYAMTAHAMQEERERCLVLGMNGHISKPIEPEVLFGLLDRLRVTTVKARPGPTTSAKVNPRISQAEPNADLPNIQGLDTSTGLRFADGKPGVYLQTLRRFVQDFAKFSAVIQSLDCSHDREIVLRSIHTLKGLAGTVGAFEIRQMAVKVEVDLEGCESGARFPASMDELNFLLTELIRALESFEGERQQLPATGLNLVHDPCRLDSAPLSVGTLKPSEILLEFRSLLLQGDSHARTLWQTNAKELAEQISQSDLAKLNIALANYDFDAALALIGVMERPL